LDDIFNKSFFDLEKKAEAILKNNLKKGITKNPPIQEFVYICPNLKSYPHQYLLDSCFHAIVNCHLDINLAKKEFETLLKRQGSDGFISHISYWQKNISLIDKIVKSYYKDKTQSPITQTPIIPQNNRNNRSNLYESRIFKDDEIPLLNIIHSSESGMDNSPVYDRALKINANGRFLTLKLVSVLIKQLKVLKKYNWEMEKIREANFFLYKDLMFNCTYVNCCRDLAFLFKKIGNEQEHDALKNRAIELEKLIIQYCWNPEKEIFFGLYGKKNNMDNIKSVLSFMPLSLDGLPRDKAFSLVEDHLLNENEFWPEFPVPSVALDEPSFTEEKHVLQRGTTLINMNWFIIKGLKKHGFVNEALELTKKTIDLVKKFGFYEFYSPYSGNGMGTKNFGRSTLIIDLIKKSKFETDLDYMFFTQDFRHIKKGGFG